MVTYFIKKFNKHLEIKDRLLELLAKEKSSSFEDISNTDWHVNINHERNYWQFLYPLIIPTLFDFYENNLFFSTEVSRVCNVWFQQYKKGDFHDWHSHNGCAYSNVYYVELGDGCPSTEFLTPITKEIVVPNVSEGDILIFPSAFAHRSPPNNSSNQKTIISFNVF